jgi:SHAQKYF class myb-like DNA-binding protein
MFRISTLSHQSPSSPIPSLMTTQPNLTQLQTEIFSQPSLTQPFSFQPQKRFIVTQTLSQSRPIKKSLRTYSSNSNQNGRWSKEEQNRFIEAIILYGDDWKKVQKHISTRSSTQARSHAQKFLLKLKKCEMIRKKKLNLNLSWAKSIQLLKKEFTINELEVVLKSVTIKKKHLSYKKKKQSNKKERLGLKCKAFDQSETNTTISSNLNEDCEDDDNSDNYDTYNYDDEWMKKDNNEYIKSFIENFNTKKVSFDFNDNTLYCSLPQLSLNE